MKKLNIQCLTLCSSIALLTACGGGGGSSSSDSTPEQRGTGGTVVATSTLVLPEQLDVVTVNDNSVSSSSVRRTLAANRGIAAYNDADTDYTSAKQRSHVWMEALEPIELVNSILCFTSQFQAIEFVNEGAYRVLVDEGRCFDKGEDAGSGAQNQQGAQSGSSDSDTPSYMEVVVNATRADDTSPMVVSAWIPSAGDDEMDEAIRFKATVYEGASDDNPFGSFTFNYEMAPSIDSSETFGGGEVKTVDVLDGFIGFTLFEEAEFGPNESSSQSASVVMSADLSDGVALTSSQHGEWGGDAYGLSFNENHILIQTADTYADLPYKAGSNNAGVCLSRDNFREAVWRYDLFNYEDGSRIHLNSGFPMRYDSDDDGEMDRHGWVGYWGVWTEGDQGLDHGDTIVRENFDDNSVRDEYTVVKAPGRLIKHTVERLPLTEVAGVKFFYWSDSAQQAGYDQWIVRYLKAENSVVSSDGFYIVGGISWGQPGGDQESESNGPTETMLEIPQTITLNEWEDTLHMWSDQLGGGVQYRDGANVIRFFKETFVNGSESDLFDEEGNLTLTCFKECPVGTLELTDLQNWFGDNSPWEAEPQNSETLSPHSYTISNGGSNMLALIKSSNSEVVKMASGITREQLQQTQFNWGLRSGPMVTAAIAATISNPWDIHDPSIVTEFYVWETGIEQWQQLTSVRDAQGQIASFDRPIEFSYQHSDANDRSGDAGEYDGQTMLMGYGGNGDFWGVPHESVGDNRWYPVVNIADGVRMGPNSEYVIKALDMERKMARAEGECTDLVINDPAAAVPTEMTGSADIGAMPDVTTPPAVIGGEIQE